MQRKEELIKALAPGDGDCFYHALMLDIIHDVLVGALKEDSEAGQRIKGILFPAINQQLVLLRIPTIDYSHLSLKECIVTLLKLAPNNQLPFFSRLPGLTSSNHISEEAQVIMQCDVYHLLRDVCAPALRVVMLDGMLIEQQQIKSMLKDILLMEFNAYAKIKYKRLLGVDDTSAAIASDYFSSGEFYGVGYNLKQPIFDVWNDLIEKGMRHQNTPLPNVDEWLQNTFEVSWQQSHDTLYQYYTSFHKNAHLMAGSMQQRALSCKLQMNLKLANNISKSIDEDHRVPSIPNAHTVYIENNRSCHFNAMLYSSSEEKKPVANALQHIMAFSNQHAQTLRKTVYPWARVHTRQNSNSSSSATMPIVETVDPCLAVNEAIKAVKASTKEVGKLLTTELKMDRDVKMKSFHDLVGQTLQHAQNGYGLALHNGIFKNTNSSIAQTIGELQENDNRAEQNQIYKDFLLAVELQNEEIIRHFSSKK